MSQRPARSGSRRTANTPTSAVAGRALRFSNLDKVLYPATGFTKGQVIDYYRQMAPLLLPHLHGRPLTLKRYPNGVTGEFFYEKNCPAHRPEWVATATVPRRHAGSVRYCLVEDLPTLLWVANLASLELHTLLSRHDRPDCPTAMVFDLDPGPGVDIVDCIPLALRLRGLLDGLGLQSLPKTSGGKGLHVYVPLNTPATFDATKTLTRAIAQALERDDPRQVTSRMGKDLRPGRIFIDWSQNDEHKTTVSVYSLRAGPVPRVSMPLAWEELQRAERRRDARGLPFTPEQALRRAERDGDLFLPMLRLRQFLPQFNRPPRPPRNCRR